MTQHHMKMFLILICLLFLQTGYTQNLDTNESSSACNVQRPCLPDSPNCKLVLANFTKNYGDLSKINYVPLNKECWKPYFIVIVISGALYFIGTL